MDDQRFILFALDETGRAERLVNRLQETPHRVVEASYPEARALLERGEAPDVLIVDIEPPSLEGFEVVRAFRRAGGSSVLALSASFKREHIEGMLENVGVRRLFPLKVDPEELMFWVNYALYPEAMRSRKTPRLPVSFVLSIAGRKRVMRGRAYNLSEDGLFLETSLEASHADVLELRFRLPDQRSSRRRSIPVRCEVVWVNPKSKHSAGEGGPYGLGLRFVDLDERVRGAIKTYVLSGLLELSI